MDWLYFAILVVIVGVVGIAVGLFFAGRLARWGERRVAEDDGTFMTAVGPLEGEAGDHGREAHELGDTDAGASDGGDSGGDSGGDGGGGDGGGGGD